MKNLSDGHELFSTGTEITKDDQDDNISCWQNKI